MLYKVGTAAEVPAVRSQLPDCVMEEISRGVGILDLAYGAGRDYLESGGYYLFAETKEDVYKLKELIDYDTHPCEWADLLGQNRQYVSALYVINNDFSVTVLMPVAIAPEAIIKELED